jgi:hypothetical protein
MNYTLLSWDCDLIESLWLHGGEASETCGQTSIFNELLHVACAVWSLEQIDTR